MVEYYFRYFQAAFKNDGQTCKGKDRCGKFEKYADSDEKIVCRGCSFYSTNPVFIGDQVSEILEEKFGKKENGRLVSPVELETDIFSEQIEDAAFIGFDICDKRDSGATFAYPGSLSIIEWLALSAITHGRSNAEHEKNKKETPAK